MTYRQLVQPNIAINETAGWCLQYARRVYGLPAVEPTAWDAWTKTRHKHQDRNFPAGVAVPVWFDWWGDVGNGRFRYGHVAVRMPDGKIWSSPLTGHGRAWFASVDDLTRAFGNGMIYVGWSEDISGTRVIEGGNMAEKVNLDTARILAHHNLARDGFDGRPDAHRGDSDGDLKKYHVGADLTNEYIRNNFFLSGEASNAFGHKNGVYRERDSLRSQLTAANKKIAELSKLPEVSAQVTAELEILRKENADVLAKNEKLAAQAESDKQAGEKMLRRVGQLISKYLPGNK